MWTACFAGATKSRPPPRQQQESGTWLRLTDEARNARDPSEASVQIQSWYRGHLGRAYAAELKVWSVRSAAARRWVRHGERAAGGGGGGL